MKLNRDFYSRDTLTVAKDLLGTILVHNIDGHILKGKIVETEGYLGGLRIRQPMPMEVEELKE